MKEVLKYYKDFPKEGIVFVDIIPFLQNKAIFRELTHRVGEACTTATIIAPEARGFLFAAPLLTESEHVENIVPVRKSGKLPFAEGDLIEVLIQKEYGCDKLYYRKSDIAQSPAEGDVIEVSILDDVDLSLKVIRIDVDITAKVTDRLNADGGFAFRSDNCDVGADALFDISAGTAFTAGKRGSVGIRAILANESLCQLKSEGVLARAVCALDDVGVRQIGIFGKQRSRKSLAKLRIADYFGKYLLQRLTSFLHKIIHSILYH